MISLQLQGEKKYISSNKKTKQTKKPTECHTQAHHFIIISLMFVKKTF